ncbi:hypothetical protein Tco_1404079 [Tanacetum coccineum]
MAQENFIEGCSTQRPPLLEPNGFCFWKARFETYVKSKDINLWQVIQNGDFYFKVEDSETKLMKETSAKVTAIEEAKDLTTFPLDELIRNLKVYETILGIDSVASKPIKDKIMPIALKSNITRGQTSSDSISQEKCDEDEEINLMAKNFRKLFQKGVKKHHKFDICKEKTKGGSSRRERSCYNCCDNNHFIDDCPKSKRNKAFVKGAWSDSGDGNEPQNDATCLMAFDSQELLSKPSSSNNDLNIINLQKENEELLKFSKDFSKTYEKLLQEKIVLEKEHSNFFSKVNELELEMKKLAKSKEVVEPCENYDVLTKEVDSLISNISKLQDEAFNFLKFKKSSVILDDMLSRQKLSQDKEGLGFSKNDKTTFGAEEVQSIIHIKAEYFSENRTSKDYKLDADSDKFDMDQKSKNMKRLKTCELIQKLRDNQKAYEE